MGERREGRERRKRGKERRKERGREGGRRANTYECREHSPSSLSLPPPSPSSLSPSLSPSLLPLPLPPPSPPPEVLVDVDGWLHKQPLKLVPGPLQSVLDGVREVLEGADRNRPLWRVREDRG